MIKYIWVLYFSFFSFGKCWNTPVYPVKKTIFISITCYWVHIGTVVLKNDWETIISPQIKMRRKWNLNSSPICSYWPDIELFTVTNSPGIDYSASIWPVHDLMPVGHFTTVGISSTESGFPRNRSGLVNFLQMFPILNLQNPGYGHILTSV